MEPPPSSAPHAAPRRIGYYFSKGKATKLGWDSFIQHASTAGVSVVELDLNKKLEDQPECSIYIHKLTDELTAASSTVETANTHGEKISMSPAQLSERLKEWQGYLSRRIALIADLDPIWAQRSSIDRVAFLAILEQMNHALPADLCVKSPNYALLNKEEPDYSASLTGIRFPVLVKTVRACGAQDAHMMSVAFSEKGLHHPDLRAPIIVQEYLNHGAIIWKIFVIGTHVAVVGRPSLCDLTLDPTRANITFNSQKGVPPELLAQQPGTVAQPPQRVLEAMASWLSARTGMTLFGFDVVVHTDSANTTCFGVIDINYFPGYSGVPDFNARLLNHALNSLAEKEKAAAAKRPLDAEDEEADDEAEDHGNDEDNEAQRESKAARVEPDEAGKGDEGKGIKRRVALCLSYNGAGYMGMQKNPAVKTIEGDLEKALFQTGRISAANYGSLAKVSWQRCARTDKGVSAQGQIVSLKVLLKAEEDIEKLPAELNAVLPPAIRVHLCLRVTQSFNAKNNCNSRTYNYLLPAFALLASGNPSAKRNTIAEAVSQFRSVMKSFIGTRSYHNFTAKVDASAGQAQRFMIFTEVHEPRVFDGVPFVLVEIRGQSFMLHQIRKMIGTAIAIVRDGQADRHYQVLTGMWAPPKQPLPMAPGLGLLLVKCHYDSYNARMRRDKVQPALEWDSVQAEMDDFKWKSLLAPIVNVELTTHSMVKWLRTLDMSPLAYDKIVQTGVENPPRHPTKIVRKK